MTTKPDRPRVLLVDGLAPDASFAIVSVEDLIADRMGQFASGAADEMLGPTLLSLHNVAFYLRLMTDAREAVAEGRFAAFHSGRLARWNAAS